MTSLQYFRLIAPEFDAESDATVNEFITMAALFVSVDLYDGETASLAVALKAASLMLSKKKSSTGASDGGTVVEEKEGDLMRKYSTDAGSNAVVDIYEQQLKQLSLGISGAGIMTRVNVPSYV